MLCHRPRGLKINFFEILVFGLRAFTLILNMIFYQKKMVFNAMFNNPHYVIKRSWFRILCMYTHNKTLPEKPIDLKMSSRILILQRNLNKNLKASFADIGQVPRFQDAPYFFSTKTAFFQF